MTFEIKRLAKMFKNISLKSKTVIEHEGSCFICYNKIFRLEQCVDIPKIYFISA